MKIIRKKLIFIIFILVAALSLGGLFIYNYFHVNIDNVLESEDYSYLPDEAKKYVKDAYEATGEVILTEKNKRKNEAYLNPRYIEYLQLNSKQKESVYNIPEAYTIDIDFSKIESEQSLSSTYILSNDKGFNFLSPMKNQGRTGLCWLFTTGEQIESLLMINSLKSYTPGVTKQFSVRQMDYAMSDNGILNYNNNDNGYRNLTTGGNFFISSIALGNGIGLVDDSKMPFNESTAPKYLEDVFGYDNGGYEVNQAVSIPGFNFDSDYTTEDFENYIYYIKTYAYLFGGAYVGTQSPEYSCGTLNVDGSVILRVDNNCVQDSGHAMHIVGWDDNYSYQYCASGNAHSSNVASCPAGSLVQGKGAWILKNSWGTDIPENYQYLYLAYDSLDLSYGITVDVSKLEDRDWDNNYHSNFISEGAYVATSDYIDINKNFDGNEKIEQVKFYSYAVDGTFKLSIMNGDEYLPNVKVVSADLPGLYTIDVSNLNLVMDKDNFKVQISGSNFIYKSISVFTSNVDSNVEAKMEDVTLDKIYTSDVEANYEFSLLSQTKNIKSGESVIYKLFDGETDISHELFALNDSDYDGIVDSRVSNNEVLTTFHINKTVSAGTYTLKMYYNNNEIGSSNITLKGLIYVRGTGKSNDPFIITSDEELEMMRDKINCDGVSCEFYYKLGNDITLTKKWIPIGTSTIPFKGGLDGGGYTIYGLDIDSERGGIFAYASRATVSNLTIDNPSVIGSGHSGVIAGYSIDLNIKNVSIIGGYVKSTNGSAGNLVGRYEVTSVRPVIDSIYNSSTVSGYISSGLIGTVSNNSSYTSLACFTSISNVLNVGNVNFKGFDGDVSKSGLLIGEARYTKLDISNVIVTGSVLDDELINYYSIVGNYNQNTVVNDGDINNIYYVNGSSAFNNDTSNKGVKKTISQLTDNSSYTSWSDFNSLWQYNTYDGINRLPSPKGLNYSYTEIDNLIIGMDKGINLLDYLSPNIEAAHNIVVSDVDEDFITIDAGFNIKGVKTGETKIKITSNYDGLIKEIDIIVVEKSNPEITFNSNDGKNTSIKQVVDLNKEFTLDENTFVRDGYKLVEWNTKSDGTGESYSDKEVIDGIINDLVLYAIWDEIKYKVIYNYNGLFSNIEVNVKYSDEFNIHVNTHERGNYTFVGWNTKSDGTGKSYSGKVSKLTKKDGDVVNLYAIWKLNLSVGSDDYKVDESNNIIDMIDNNTNVDTFKKKFNVTSGFRVEVDTTDSNLIYTGGKTKIYDGDKLIVEFVNVIRGDINGDGKISALDYVKVKNHIMKTNIIGSDTIYFMAADANNDDNISALDYVRIKNIIMKGAN